MKSLDGEVLLKPKDILMEQLDEGGMALIIVRGQSEQLGMLSPSSLTQHALA